MPKNKKQAEAIAEAVESTRAVIEDLGDDWSVDALPRVRMTPDGIWVEVWHWVPSPENVTTSEGT
jgi:hypothetical protein